MTKLKIVAHRQSCVAHSPVKKSQSTSNTVYTQARCQAQTLCPNELSKTISDEKFLIVQAWVQEIWTLPEKNIAQQSVWLQLTQKVQQSRLIQV